MPSPILLLSLVITVTCSSTIPPNTNFTAPILKQPIAPPWHTDGPMPIISDSVFSLIILIYVSVIFVFMFFSFCWKEPGPPPPDPTLKNIPMITEMLDEMEQQEKLKQDEDINRINGVEETEMDSFRGEVDSQCGRGGETILVNVVTEKTQSLVKLNDDEEVTTDTRV